MEVEQAPVRDGLREPGSQEEGGELLGPHHAGVLQPRHVAGDLEQHGLTALVLVEAEPVMCAQPHPAGGNGGQDGPAAWLPDVGLPSVEVSPPTTLRTLWAPSFCSSIWVIYREVPPARFAK